MLFAERSAAERSKLHPRPVGFAGGNPFYTQHPTLIVIPPTPYIYLKVYYGGDKPMAITAGSARESDMNHYRWTKEEVQALKDMPKNKETIEAVAKRLGRTLTSVESKLRRLYEDDPNWWR